MNSKCIENFEDFVIEVQNALEQFYGEDAEVYVREILKNNGVKLRGLCIIHPGGGPFPTIYLEPFYEEYRRCREFGSVIQKLIHHLEQSSDNLQLDLTLFTDYEKAKDRIMYKLVNYQNNEQLLMGVPHMEFLNLAIVFYVQIFQEELFNGTILIRDEHMKNWGVTLEQLYEMARINTERANPVKLLNMKDLMEELQCKHPELPDVSGLDVSMYVITNAMQRFGASVILYEGTLRKLEDYVGERYAVIPSSIHEMIVIPVENYEQTKDLADMIQEINELEVAPEEVLSDYAYYYEHEAGIVMAAE